VLHRHAAGQQLLMVCHGNTIRTLMPLFGGLHPEESILIQLNHASITILDVMIYGEAVLRLANSVDHLAPDEVTEDNSIEGLNLSDVG
jgi:broad specificity phosphatase PhoE